MPEHEDSEFEEHVRLLFWVVFVVSAVSALSSLWIDHERALACEQRGGVWERGGRCVVGEEDDR